MQKHIKRNTKKIKKIFLILQYNTLKSTAVGTTAGLQGQVHIFESLKLEVSYVGDLP